MSRQTGPSWKVVQLVRARDGGCVRCGSIRDLSTQHRVPRGMGGTRWTGINQPSNLLTLCGSGTTGCHGWVERHREEARRFGWAVSHYTHPADRPVLYTDGWWLLSDDGTRARAGGHAGSSGGGGSEAGHDPGLAEPWAPRAS